MSTYHAAHRHRPSFHTPSPRQRGRTAVGPKRPAYSPAHPPPVSLWSSLFTVFVVVFRFFGFYFWSSLDWRWKHFSKTREAAELAALVNRKFTHIVRHIMPGAGWTADVEYDRIREIEAAALGGTAVFSNGVDTITLPKPPPGVFMLASP